MVSKKERGKERREGKKKGETEEERRGGRGGGGEGEREGTVRDNWNWDGKNLRDELEAQCSGNSQELLRVTLAGTASNG